MCLFCSRFPSLTLYSIRQGNTPWGKGTFAVGLCNKWKSEPGLSQNQLNGVPGDRTTAEMWEWSPDKNGATETSLPDRVAMEGRGKFTTSFGAAFPIGTTSTSGPTPRKALPMNGA